jgi:phosphatidylglycerol:prolipoprotein diacylglycerol transferase
VPTTDRVHPTPIYEFLAGVIIAAYLWRMATKAVNGAGSHGEIISSYLIWTGVARFLVEFIRVNPKVFYGLTNAQVVSLLSIAAGAILLLRVRNRLPAHKEGNQITGRAS